MYVDDFKEYDYYHSLMAMYHQLCENEEDFLKAIDYAREATDRMKDHAGILHHFCELIVEAYEERLPLPQQDLDHAIFLIEKCIYLNDKYAKYYATKARLLASHDKFKEAIANIHMAIDLESHESTDYTVRINEYTYHLTQIKMQKQLIQINESINSSVETIEDAEQRIKKSEESTFSHLKQIKTDNIQMLAFFTAMISFIISSITILSRQASFISSAALILIFDGALIFSYIAFSILLFPSRKEQFAKYAVISGFAFLLMLLGLLIHLLLGGKP
jgi:tetratricopeptide (TPR) repeat protein